MTMTYTYAIALGEARSCLAALADITADVDQSAFYDRLLIQLDWLTDDVGPATHPITANRAALLDRLEAAVNVMLDLGGADGLSLDLLLDSALNPAGSLAGEEDRLGGSLRGPVRPLLRRRTPSSSDRLEFGSWQTAGRGRRREHGGPRRRPARPVRRLRRDHLPVVPGSRQLALHQL